MRILFLLFVGFLCQIAVAQKNPIYESNIGKVTFMNGNIPLEQYQKSDFLTAFELAYKSDLNIRFFTDNTIVNYLHELAPALSTEDLLKMGNLQFSFYINDKFIYKENIHPDCHFGSASNKNSATTFSIPLTSTKKETRWSLNMWERFKINGGEKSLTEGKHKLKIEIRPYIAINGDTKVGNTIATGQIQLIIKTPTATAEQVKIQPIQTNSGWAVSNFEMDRSKIELLNKDIAIYNLKEITSVVAVYDGKLLLEEYFNDANRNTLHDTRSAGKSFASTLLGMAIQDKHIKDENQKLHTFYNLKQYQNYDVKKDSVALKDLLTMSSAFEGSDINSESPGNEENMYPTDNWVKFALDLPMDPLKTNGGKWDYFTAGVVVLGDVLDKNVPGGLEKYADEKLFKPLDITNYQWQYTPQKVANTAGSLQMRSLDYAKYAQLYKNNGRWNGKQILSESWVQKTLSKQKPIPEAVNQFYGYLFWNKTVTYKGTEYETYYCAGNGGNEFIIFKNLPLVVIITSKAFNKPYGHAQADKIVADYLLPAILK